jgi:outer membrane protein assembly factor BamE (lipoprotein component of BamABCDE complex)
MAALAFMAVSCGTSRRELNIQHMAHLKKGMTKQEVLDLMGRPLENEVYNTDKVWYYFIESKWADGMITRDECLPIFFENDRVAGWGQEEYKKYRQKNW